jgi:2-polyprenyl-6-methoxyphenol hydroxylase-like FAD-dependent oxidoreductase
MPDLDVAIVGAGFGGLGMATRLRHTGLHYVVLEKAAYRRQLRRFDVRDYRVSPSPQPGS